MEKGKVLVHNGKYVDVERLKEGIFYTSSPSIIPKIYTIESLIDTWQYQDWICPQITINLLKCKLLKQQE